MAITIDTILKVQALKIEAEQAYDRYNAEIDKIYAREGEGSHSGPIQEDEDRNKFIRLTITDNIQKLQRGEPVVGISMVKPLGVKISLLKNKPKDL